MFCLLIVVVLVCRSDGENNRTKTRTQTKQWPLKLAHRSIYCVSGSCAPTSISLPHMERKPKYFCTSTSSQRQYKSILNEIDGEVATCDLKPGFANRNCKRNDYRFFSRNENKFVLVFRVWVLRFVRLQYRNRMMSSATHDTITFTKHTAVENFFVTQHNREFWSQTYRRLFDPSSNFLTVFFFGSFASIRISGIKFRLYLWVLFDFALFFTFRQSICISFPRRNASPAVLFVCFFRFLSLCLHTHTPFVQTQSFDDFCLVRSVFLLIDTFQATKGIKITKFFELNCERKFQFSWISTSECTQFHVLDVFAGSKWTGVATQKFGEKNEKCIRH